MSIPTLKIPTSFSGVFSTSSAVYKSHVSLQLVRSTNLLFQWFTTIATPIRDCNSDITLPSTSDQQLHFILPFFSSTWTWNHLLIPLNVSSVISRSTSAPMMIPATHDERPTFALASCNFRFPRRAPPGTRINIARLLILHSYFKPQL
ncbi:PREDICTED: uncharacterized protein LOC106327233 isoform X1 [Brassica oleracea var. oleracea]|uniref:uncharacterized protein LOC106327233 isoform X1 n=1 Tax=Brassica oleracea var. oleracea TaxID=109376 RepID=UPI0006A75596|nr:PREDICTED: uncharacterized protein LOC106327233 isoform X1 [Brassica oleracea var. oleracea]XP_013620777.1 PREDICTED: uncharacterized protein LOC106327233 isoform X1 [Brassica oleracea var. oleracea]XP_013620779.1 PREDICTED: uncharacterized protein LOC106327233 isoform X1 [Brassica oleracea var. oleracea]